MSTIAELPPFKIWMKDGVPWVAALHTGYRSLHPASPEELAKYPMEGVVVDPPIPPAPPKPVYKYDIPEGTNPEDGRLDYLGQVVVVKFGSTRGHEGVVIGLGKKPDYVIVKYLDSGSTSFEKPFCLERKGQHPDFPPYVSSVEV